MHNYSTRIQTLSSWYSSAVFLLMGLMAISNYLLISPILFSPTALSIPKLAPNTVKLKPQRVSRTDFKSKKPDLARVTFDLEADLSPLFKWNTKLLFVSVVAEFSNDQYNFNQVCIWDDIIRNKEDAVLNLKKKVAENPIHDLKDALAGTKANLTLQYQVIPWVGFFFDSRRVFPDALVFPQISK